MVVGKRITWYTDILRWGRNWVCSGLSLGFIHGTWQRSRVSDLDYDCVAEFTTYNYIYICQTLWFVVQTRSTHFFLAGCCFFFHFVLRLLVHSKLVMMLMIMHDHHHDMPTFVASAHTFDFFLHICTGGSLSFWCRGIFSDAFGGGELHQEQLDDVMGQAVWIHTSIGGWCEPTKRVGTTWGSDAVNSLQCHWNDGNWTRDEWGNKFKLAQLFRWVD